MVQSKQSKIVANASERLTMVKNFITNTKIATTIPWDPDCTVFPKRNELPSIPGAPEGAAWVWGPEDNLGRINLLTPTRVAAASREIRTGEIVPMNLPLNVPEQPGFAREKFEHTIKCLAPGVAYDDVYSMNTQSGTQWDGFRHFAHMPSGRFYNNTKDSDIQGEQANDKCSMHHLANHGIAGRGILIDYRGYAERHNIQYNVWDNYRITHSELAACAKEQGIDILPASQGGDIQIGDILFIRSGWVQAYQVTDPEESKRLALRDHQVGPSDGQRYAGLAQEDKMLDWLHDCYFAAVAGDAPSFEAWPSEKDYYLHEHLLALWGCPIGEMLDLEKLAVKCRERGRWTFFFTSAPFNTPGGVGSLVNGQAIL